MPIKNGNGESMTSIIVAGKIGISTCFHANGNMNEVKETATYVNKDLCLDTNKIFCSSKS